MAATDETPARSRAARPRLIRRSVAAATFAATLLAPSAQALQVGPDGPHSPNTSDMATAYWVLIVIATLIVIAVNGALLAALIRFRARRGRVPARITAGRRVVARPAAGFGALALALFVFGVIVADNARTVDAEDGELGSTAGLRAQVPIAGVPEPEAEAPEGTAEPPGQVPETEQAAGTPPVEIDAIGQQWLWRFEYPSDEREDIATLFSYGELVVPVDTPVILNITSTDVMHSWWVPELTGQVQAVPGDLSQTWFRADEVGVYEGRGTVFDGTLYPSMTASVRVVDSAEYQTHLEELAEDLSEAQQAVEDVTATEVLEEVPD